MRFLQFLIINLLIGCSFNNERSVKDHSMYWHKNSAEYKALCLQAYNIAKKKLELELSKDYEKPLAIIADLDETIFDNIPKNTLFINDNDKNLRVVVSRSHINDETNEYIKKLNQPKLISCGSSLKFLYIADNKADIYPRFGPTMEWDTAAAHSILSSLDIMVMNLDTGRELSYNKENLLNPFFIIKP